jgi:galactose mutarotase-like enzyme
VRGGIPVLFPICGGLPGNVLPLPEGEFPLPQHGFARLHPWSLGLLPDETGVRLQLEDTPATRQSFPFRFLLTLDLRLAPGALSIEAAVTNRGDRPLPFSFGLHPYFVVSDPATARIEGLPPQCLDHHTMEAAATADQLGRLAEGVDLLAGPVASAQLLDGDGRTGVELQTGPPLDLVVVWSDPPRPMVCLEPWTGPRRALISGDRRLEVAPGEQCLLRCRYGLLAP